jgi:hypothetical protein
LNVLVTGTDDCNKLKNVFLIINGDDDMKARRINLDHKTGCHWTAELGDGTISTSIARISLRAGRARSGCQKATPGETELFANLEFSCCLVEDKFKKVMVKIEPPMPVSYVRYVQPFAEDRIPVPCSEAATFAQGQGELGNALFDREEVYLHLGPFNLKRQTLGLLLNPIVVDTGTLVLTRDGVVYRLIVQRAKGKSRSAPTASSNAITVDIKKLGELKFERAEIEVVK